MPRDVVGEDTVNRLAERLDEGSLGRRNVPGGGTAYSGPLATRALEALGARAMTVDNSIIVSEDFDPSNPEDRALFAHEQYHVEHGDGQGGGGGHDFSDAEELAARSVERMVLHRETMGGDAGYAPSAGAGAPDHSPHSGSDQSQGGVGTSAPRAQPSGKDANRKPDPELGYLAMRNEGKSHDEIVEELAEQVLGALQAGSDIAIERHQDKKGWL